MQVTVGDYRGTASLPAGLVLNEEDFDFYIEIYAEAPEVVLERLVIEANARGYETMPFWECPPEYEGDLVRHYLVPITPVEREGIL